MPDHRSSSDREQGLSVRGNAPWPAERSVKMRSVRRGTERRGRAVSIRYSTPGTRLFSPGTWAGPSIRAWQTDGISRESGRIRVPLEGPPVRILREELPGDGFRFSFQSMFRPPKNMGRRGSLILTLPCSTLLCAIRCAASKMHAFDRLAGFSDLHELAGCRESESKNARSRRRDFRTTGARNDSRRRRAAHDPANQTTATR